MGEPGGVRHLPPARDVVAPLPTRGTVFTDARDDERTLRVSWHEEQAAFVLSTWRGRECRASFRLPAAEVPRLLAELGAGLVDGLAVPRAETLGA